MSALDRNVLPQDQPQYQESTAKARKERDEREYQDALTSYEKEKAEIDKQNAEIEKQNKLEQERYDKELAAYNKELAEYEKSQLPQKQYDEREKQYDDNIAKLEAEKQKLLQDAHTRWATVEQPMGASRKDLAIKQNKITTQYQTKINSVVEERRITLGTMQFSMDYPDRKISTSVLRTFRDSPTFNLGSLQEKKDTAAAAKLAYDKRAGAINARNAPRYTKQQEYVIQKGFTGLRGSPTPEMQARENLIKPTPDIITGQKAIKTRAPLINVKTVETIYGGKQIPTNPRSYVASLDRQNLTPAGKPIKEKIIPPVGLTQTGKVQVSNLNEWNGQQTGKVRVSDPKIDRMIGFYGYEKTNEIIGNYNRITTSNNLLIKQENKKNRIEYYKYRRQQVREDKYFKSPKAQGPPKPKYETVVGVPGSLEYLLPKEQTQVNPITKSFEDYVKEINPQSEINQNKFKDRSGLAEPISTLDIALIASPGGRILGVGKLLERGASKIIPALKPLEKQTNKFLISKTSQFLDAGIIKKQKVFSYEVPYKPTKRPNEINLSGGGEIIGKFSNIKSRPIAAKQSDVRIPIKPKPDTVKLDPFYKPRGRFEGGFKDLQTDTGEIVGKNTPLSKSPVPKQSDVRLPVLKKINPIQRDPFYKPAKRPNEIDITRDDVLTEFTITKIRLGKGRTKPNDILKGKQDKPVAEDYFYKPAKRPNEIDYTDVAGDPKIIKKENLKSEVQLSLKRELKRIKRLQPEFKTRKINLEGTGQYIAGKSGRQQLLQIQKSEQITKKKLVTKRQTPVNVNWVEKTDTIETPRTESAPVVLILPKKETKKKTPYLQDYTQTYENPLSAQRPQIKTIPSLKVENRLATPQRTSESIKYSTIQPQRIQESFRFAQPQRIATQPKYREAAQMKPRQNYIVAQKIKLVQRQKLTAPLQPKQPTRLAQPTKLKQPVKLVFRYDSPRPQRPPRVIAGFYSDDKKKKEPKRTAQPGEKENFLGNVSESSIIGIYNRIETTYGDKKINKLLMGDRRVSRGQRRSTPRRQKKWVEGKGSDPFGFNNEQKKKSRKRSFWI
jgi:hypothetical protein